MTSQRTNPRVFYYFFRIYRNIELVLEQTLQSEGLTAGQYTILSALKRFEPCTSAELARKQSITAQSMGEYLTALESKGLIERNHIDGNRRDIIVCRSPNGIAVNERCNEKVLAAEAEFLSCLPKDEIDDFVTHLNTLYHR